MCTPDNDNEETESRMADSTVGFPGQAAVDQIREQLGLTTETDKTIEEMEENL